MLYSRASIFSEWPKPAQPYFLSLGVTTISMHPLQLFTPLAPPSSLLIPQLTFSFFLNCLFAGGHESRAYSLTGSRYIDYTGCIQRLEVQKVNRIQFFGR